MLDQQQRSKRQGWLCLTVTPSKQANDKSSIWLLWGLIRVSAVPRGGGDVGLAVSASWIPADRPKVARSKLGEMGRLKKWGIRFLIIILKFGCWLLRTRRKRQPTGTEVSENDATASTPSCSRSECRCGIACADCACGVAS